MIPEPTARRTRQVVTMIMGKIEANLMLHPIAVGHGRRLFEDTPTYPLQLVSNKTFQTGVLNLSYVPASG
jgi:hypothetical protein